LIRLRGDGYLSVFDVRRPELVARSDNQEDELLSLAVVRVSKHIYAYTHIHDALGWQQSSMWYTEWYS
jgi:hypothetical protein